MTRDVSTHPMAHYILLTVEGDKCMEEARQFTNAGNIGAAVLKVAEYIDRATPILDSDQIEPQFKEILARRVATCYVMRAAGLLTMAQQGHPQANKLVRLAREDAERMMQFPIRWFSDEERTVLAQLAQLFEL